MGGSDFGTGTDLPRVSFLGTMPQWARHIAPVWRALPDAIRGGFYTSRRPPFEGDVFVVASERDRHYVKHSPVIRFEHGVGFSFQADERMGRHSGSYAGGPGQTNVTLFVNPNRWPDQQWARAYPDTPTAIVGMPAMDGWHRAAPKQRNKVPIVAVAWHWDCKVCPETRYAFPYYHEAVRRLAQRTDIRVVGHGHPRAPQLAGWFRGAGIPYVADLDDVYKMADLYVNDASSTLYEFASLGRPVVIMNSPAYRPRVNHGLRFWEHADIGPAIWRGNALDAAVNLALADEAPYPERRAAAVAEIFPHRGHAAEEAARVISDHVGYRPAAATSDVLAHLPG